MSSVISGVCRGARLLCEAADLVNSVDKMSAPTHASDSAELRAASVAVRVILLGLGATETIALAGNASNSTLKNVKSGETFLRLVDLPIKVCEGILDSETVIGFIEKGVLAPVSSLV